MWHHLFLEFWLVHTWVLAHWHHRRAVTLLENICQLNIIRDKKLGFQLSHTHPLNSSSANSPNVKPVALKVWTSAIPSNIPVDCAGIYSSGNAFPSILWNKEALLVFFRSQMMPTEKIKLLSRSTFLFCILIVICANTSLWYFKGIILSLTEILKTLTRSLNVLSFNFFTGS